MGYANVVDFLGAVRKGTGYFLTTKEILPGGTGPCGPAGYYTCKSLDYHTIYAPVNMEEGKKYPLLIWANGAGMAWGLMFAPFLREIASHGYIVLANGRPKTILGMMDHKGMIQSLEWASTNGDEETGIRKHIDLFKIALAGQSKGGLDSYVANAALAFDRRIKSIALFNSGLLTRNKKTLKLVTDLLVPTFFFIGGPADVAYENAEKDWKLLPKKLPAWIGNLPVGHMGTFYDDENGGAFATAAVLWLDFVLKDDEAAKEELLKYDQKDWKVCSQNL